MGGVKALSDNADYGVKPQPAEANVSDAPPPAQGGVGEPNGGSGTAAASPTHNVMADVISRHEQIAARARRGRQKNN